MDGRWNNYFGGYPGGASLIGDEDCYAQYIRDALIETAISKDILVLTRVEKPALLRQLFVLACEYAGQVLSYQKIMGQFTGAGNTVTLVHYQRLLESAFLIQGLPQWSGAAVRRRSSSPKWQPLNTALVAALAGRSFKEWRSDAESCGRLVEVAVGAHLANSGFSGAVHVFYWREENREVDFVLYKGKTTVAVEVKSGRSPKTLPGLAEFAARNRVKRTLVVGGHDLGLREFLETPLTRWFE